MNIFFVMLFYVVVSARDSSIDVEVKIRNKAKRLGSFVGKLKSVLFTLFRINDVASVKFIRDRYLGRGVGVLRLKR